MHTGPGGPANPDRKPSPFSSPGAWGRSFVLFLLKKDFGLLCVPPRHCNLVQSRLLCPKPQRGALRLPQDPPKQLPGSWAAGGPGTQGPLRRPRPKAHGAQTGLCKLPNPMSVRMESRVQARVPGSLWRLLAPVFFFPPPGDRAPHQSPCPTSPLPPTAGKALSSWGEGP